MNKILVTGGAGFIGSHLIDKLIEKNYKVVVIDNLSTGKKENLNSQANFYKIDILDSKISQIFQKEKPEIVFHLASQVKVSLSKEDPVKDAKINILGSLNILENCRKFKVKNFIFASSAGIYGNIQNLPIKENFPQNPISPYPAAKLSVEKYLNYYHTQGLNFISLRISNVYGPRQVSSGGGGVVAIFLDKLLRGERPIIFGNGRQTRDFLYVKDVVSVFLKVLELDFSSIFNVGTGRETSIKALYDLILKKLKKNLPPFFAPPREGDIQRSCLDISKIKKDIGWKPRYDLEKGLEKTIQWFLKN